MDVTSDRLTRAKERAAQRSAVYRAGGRWSGEPLDLTAGRQWSDAVAVVDRQGSMSFRELADTVEATAAYLSELGVGPGVAVLLALGNDRESVVAFHAVMRLDGVPLLVPRSVGQAHLEQIVRQTGVGIGLAPSSWTLAQTTAADCRWYPMPPSTEAVPEGVVLPTVRRPADEPSVVLFTSGTTARPKGVVHSIATLAAAAENYREAAGLSCEDRILLVSPLSSVTGVLQGLLLGPLFGLSVVLEERWRPAETYQLLVDSGATWYGGPDLLLDTLLDQAVDRGDRTVPLKAVYLGGTMLDQRVVERVEREFGIVVMRAYGSSEVPVSTSGLRGEPAAARHADDGVPLQDVEVRIDADSGECSIRGPHAFLGYIDPEDDEVLPEGGWFPTGDLAELRDGRLRIVGRIRDIVIRNGLKIPVAEVEEIVNRLPGVRRSVGFAVPDPQTGERLVLAIQADPGAHPSMDHVVRAVLTAGLAKYKAPEEIVHWQGEFPVNPTGKVERRRLEELAQSYWREKASRLR